MRTTVLIVLLAGALLAAPSAHAKVLHEVSVCGAHGCVDRTDKASEAMMGQKDRIDPPAAKSGWYEIEVAVGDEARVIEEGSFLYVPGAKAIRSLDETGTVAWYAAQFPRILDRVVEGVPPRHASTLSLAGAQAPPPPVARVVETFAPALDAAPGGDGFPWLILLLPGALGVALAGWRYRVARAAGTSAADPQTASAPRSAPAS